MMKSDISNAEIEKVVSSLLEEDAQLWYDSRVAYLSENCCRETLEHIGQIGKEYKELYKLEDLVRAFLNHISANIKAGLDGDEIISLASRTIIPLLKFEERVWWVFSLLRISPANLWLPESEDLASLPSSAKFDSEFMIAFSSCIYLDKPVLIIGESGTGKELFAKAIHMLSSRRDQQFIALNAAGIPRELVESELFGYNKGAFSGADGDKDGFFKEVGTGTFFLDEIGDMAVESQAKLLRVLEDKHFIPLGTTTKLRFQARFVCASNRDIRSLIDKGVFRRDLYHRINTFQLTLPPLRKVLKAMSEESDPENDYRRRLFESIVSDIAYESGHEYEMIINDQVIRVLSDYNYPGNYRELKNLLTRAFAATMLAGHNEIDIDSLFFQERDSELVNEGSHNEEFKIDIEACDYNTIKKKLDEMRDEVLARKIRSLLKKNKGLVKLAAAEAGLGTGRQATTNFTDIAKTLKIDWLEIRRSLRH